MGSKSKLFSARSSSVLQIREVLCRFYTRTRVVIKIYIFAYVYIYVYKPKYLLLQLLFRHTYITPRVVFIADFNPSYSSHPSLNLPHTLHPRMYDLQCRSFG